VEFCLIGEVHVLAPQRQAAIVARVHSDGGVRVADLVADFGVSDMTIRRDLEALAERGLLAKVHGGATLALPGSTNEPGFAAKAVQQRAEKTAIAARAAVLVQPGAAIALSAGTTTAELARRLVDVPGLTVLTNSVPVADIFYRAERSDVTVVLTGGQRTPSDALVGPIAAAAIRTLHPDLLFLGVHGISERAGLTTPNLMEAEIDRAMVDAAGTVVVLADHTKWNTIGIASIASLDQVDELITDSGLAPSVCGLLADRVGSLTIAEVAP
jgi:DeoR/GlpR family transcriptional regulator of sugar metabolism